MELLPSLTRLHTERQLSKTTDIRLQKADLSFFFLNYFNMFLYLTLFEVNPQNGQTNSKNSSAKANKLSVFDHFAGLAL